MNKKKIITSVLLFCMAISLGTADVLGNAPLSISENVPTANEFTVASVDSGEASADKAVSALEFDSYLSTTDYNTPDSGTLFTINKAFEKGEIYEISFKVRSYEEKQRRTIRIWAGISTSVSKNKLCYQGALDGTTADGLPKKDGCVISPADGEGWYLVKLTYQPEKDLKMLYLIVNGDYAANNDKYNGSGVLPMDFDDFKVNGKLLAGGDFPNDDVYDEFNWRSFKSGEKVINLEIINGSQTQGENKENIMSKDHRVQGLIVNQDPDGYIKSLADGNYTVENIKEFALQFKGSHITDYIIQVNNSSASYPSDVWTDLVDKYHQTVENGVAVDYKNEALTKAAHYLYEVLKADYIDIWINTFREIGINPWISFRMNDAHHLKYGVDVLLSDYFHENPQNRRVLHHSTPQYFDYCQNYELEAVREHYLALINEALGKYDPYGIELDFQREMWLWQIGKEQNGIEILNSFMRDVRSLADTYEEKYGHEIKIGVRVASDIETNYDFGLDVVTWAREGLIDMITPTGRHTTTDNGIPVETWCSVMKPYGVAVAPCIEAEIKASPTSDSGNRTNETYAGAAAAMLSQGADKVYLYNCFLTAKTIITDADRVITTDSRLSVLSAKGYWSLINTIGSYDRLMEVDRKVIVTYNDVVPIWETVKAQLPLTLIKGAGGRISVHVGDVADGSTVLFKFSAESELNAAADKLPTVVINSHTAKFVGTEKPQNGVTADTLLCFEVPASALDGPFLVADITAGDYLVIKYAEVLIKAPEMVSATKYTPSEWAKDEVNSAIDAGLVPGELQYNLTEKITREEFCTLVMTLINKAAGVGNSKELLAKYKINYADSFDDTNSSDVIAANLIGIVNGRGDGIFDPTAGITRQEAAKMLSAAANVLSIAGGASVDFADIDNAGDWAKSSITNIASIVSRSGRAVMGGVGNNNFDALGAYTREQSILTVWRLYDSITNGAKLSVYAAANITDTSDEVKASGVFLRADAGNVTFDSISSCGATGVILKLGNSDAAGLISSIRQNGMQVFVSVSVDGCDTEAAKVLEKYDVDGFEIDLMSGNAKEMAMRAPDSLDEYLAKIRAVHALLTEYEDKLGHKIALSVRCGADITSNYYLGFDISELVAAGIVDIITPTVNSVKDGVIYMSIFSSLVNNSTVSVIPELSQTDAAFLAGEAAVLLSGGADGICADCDTVVREYGASASILGELDRLVMEERAVRSDTSITLKANGMGYIRMMMGNVAADSEAVVGISISSGASENHAIYINSVKAEYKGTETAADGSVKQLYTVPRLAYDDMHAVVEIIASETVTVTGAELIIFPSK